MKKDFLAELTLEVEGMEEKILSAFEKVSEQKDLVVVGCDDNFSEGSAFGLSGLRLMGLLNANALFVEKYECHYCVDFLLELKNVVGRPMMGVVFNMVEAVHIPSSARDRGVWLYSR